MISVADIGYKLKANSLSSTELKQAIKILTIHQANYNAIIEESKGIPIHGISEDRINDVHQRFMGKLQDKLDLARQQLASRQLRELVINKPPLTKNYTALQELNDQSLRLL